MFSDKRARFSLAVLAATHTATGIHTLFELGREARERQRRGEPVFLVQAHAALIVASTCSGAWACMRALEVL